MKIKSITVQGKRWFQRTYGNTYHTARVLIDGKEVFYSPITYGYDRHYYQTAIKWLGENGYLEPFGERWNLCGKYAIPDGVTVDESVIDVPRKRDL